MTRGRLRTAIVLLLVAACAPGRTVTPPATGTIETAQVLRSPRGMVVSGSPIASSIGARVLEEGGNAVDAAVATAFALSVVEPSMSGIGGRTQLLIRTRKGEFFGIDGGTAVPESYPPGTVPSSDDAYGYQTIGVPGTVAALASALARYGTWPLARAIAPAIAIASAGFDLPPAEAARFAGEAARLKESEGGRRYFLKPDGTPYKAGDRFVQTDLARTLEAIAKGGPRAFYKGAIAEQMSADVRAHGGFLQVSDIEKYAADESLVVRGSYRGYELVGTYLPASGVTTIETMQILENFDLAPIAGSAEWASLVTQALLLAFDDREAELGTPEQKAAALVSKARAKERAGLVRRASSNEEPYQSAAEWAYEPEHTTHLSVADGKGGIVALTQSVGPSLGSKVAANGLGFLFAATMGYLGDVRPGDRPFSSQSPLIVLQNGEPRFVLGAAGARRIIPAIVTTLSRSIDQRLLFEEAMAAPRLHALPDRVDVENRAQSRWSDSTVADLRALGFNVRQRDDAPYFARIHGIYFDTGTRQFVGVADPRWTGAAAAPR